MPYNINPPVNVSPSQMFNMGGNLQDTFKGAAEAYQMGGQVKQQQRQAAFLKALDETVREAGDFTTPDGQKKIVQGLAQRGFGAEAQEIAQKLPQPEAPKTGTWRDATGTATPTIYNDLTAEVKPLGVPGKPPKPENDPWQGTTWVTSGGKKIMVDANGNDKNGRPVVQDKDPKEPKGGLTESQTAGILDRIARRADDDPALKNLERRENFYTTAKTAYEQYTNSAPEVKGEARRQADQQILFSLAKMRDEGVVMPGEFARETSGQGWLTGMLNKVASGVTSGLDLSDPQRQFIVDLMGKFRDQAKGRAKPRFEFYRKQGEKYGDPDYATGQWAGYFTDAAPGAPAPTTQGGLPTHDQYDSLPSGAEFTDPQGNVRRKP